MIWSIVPSTTLLSPLHLCLVLVRSTGISWGSTIPPYITTSTKSPHLHPTHKIECLWCHHLERSRDSCSTAELSFKRLHPASRWAPACCQCPIKWLVTAAWDTRRDRFKRLHTLCIWHACMHTSKKRQIYLCKVQYIHMLCYDHNFDHCWIVGSRSSGKMANICWFQFLHCGEWLLLFFYISIFLHSRTAGKKLKDYGRFKSTIYDITMCLY